MEAEKKQELIAAIAAAAAKEGVRLYGVAVMDGAGLEEKKICPGNLSHNSYSVAKAFTMTAIGMLYDRGLIRREDRVYDIFAEEFPSEFDEKWKLVTVEHLLKHRVGFAKKGLLDIDCDDLSTYPTDDFLAILFREPLIVEPGTVYLYTDAAFYLLSRIVSKKTGMKLVDFLSPMLYGKMGFRELASSQCPKGYSMGATGLFLRTADMVKLGYLYLSGGVYNGEQLLSKEWVDLAVTKQYELYPKHENGLYGKGGMFGQMLCISDPLGVAIAWHGYSPGKKMQPLFDAIGTFGIEAEG